MYNRDWARSIVVDYWKLRTRAQQINICLQQLYHESTGRELLVKDIQDALVDSVQGKSRKALWTNYKTLVRKSPLDRKLLEKVSKSIDVQIDVEKLQRQFDFS